MCVCVLYLACMVLTDVILLKLLSWCDGCALVVFVRSQAKWGIAAGTAVTASVAIPVAILVAL